MIQTGKKPKKDNDDLKSLSRQLKYILKYHAKKLPVDIKASTIKEHQKNTENIVDIIISSKQLTWAKIKVFLQIIFKYNGPLAEIFIDAFLDCLIDQKHKEETLTLNTHCFAESVMYDTAWIVFQKICASKKYKKHLR